MKLVLLEILITRGKKVLLNNVYKSFVYDKNFIRRRDDVNQEF